MRLYLLGWLITLLIVLVTPIPSRTLGGDAITAVTLLAWPLLWVLAAVNAVLMMRDGR